MLYHFSSHLSIRESKNEPSHKYMWLHILPQSQGKKFFSGQPETFFAYNAQAEFTNNLIAQIKLDLIETHLAVFWSA